MKLNKNIKVATELESTNRYYSVQLLRGFAALLVVFCHSMKIVHDKLDKSFWEFTAGGAGVDVFFAISGFVIFLTSVGNHEKPQKWSEFLWRRIVRIVPLYWLLTGLKLVILTLSPDIAQHSSVDLWHAVSSFLFIPAWNIDHRPLPLLQVGWTLSYEMFFYFLFAVTLAFRVRPIGWLSIVLLILSLIGLWRTDEWGAVSKLLSPILIEFIFGMWIAFVTVKGWKMPIKLVYVTIPIMIAIIVATNILPEELCLRFRVVIWGIPGALLLIAVLALENRFNSYLAKISNLIGNASYAIYLTHGFVLPFVVVVFTKLHLDNIFWKIIIILLCLIGSTVAGIAVHLWVEKPISKYIRQKYFRKNKNYVVQ